MKLLTRDEEFLAFERVLVAAQERHPIPILSWCIMSNDWHFVVAWPKKEGELTLVPLAGPHPRHDLSSEG